MRPSTGALGEGDDGVLFVRVPVAVLAPDAAGKGENRGGPGWRLFNARDQQMRDIVAEGLQEIYCKDGGRRAQDLEVAFTEIDYFELSF